MLTPYQFASNTPIQAIDIEGLEAIMHVYLFNKNSYTNWTVDFRSKINDSNFTLYANQEKYGTRGTLSVFHDLATDTKLEVFELSTKDWFQNLFSGGPKAGLTEVGGGIMFTLTNGQGKESRFSGNAEIGPNLDNLLGAFDIAKATGSLPPKTLLEAFDFLSEAFQAGITLTGLHEQVVNPVDSVCNSCPGDPHGSLPYRRLDENGMIIDTIDPGEKQ